MRSWSAASGKFGGREIAQRGVRASVIVIVLPRAQDGAGLGERGEPVLLGHTKLESTVRYLGIEVDDALEIAEQTDV